jgi:hypothetical protein
MKKILFVLGILVLGNLQYSIIFKNNNISDFFFLNQQNTKLLEGIKKLLLKILFLKKKLKNYHYQIMRLKTLLDTI